MASEKLGSLKEYAVAAIRGELRFKELRALDDVSFEVRKGDVFGIVGTNGSGKSTMLKVIAGVLKPTKGSIEISGSIAPLIELGAGFDLELTARENIFLNGALLGYSKKFIQAHFDKIVDFAEVRDFLDMPMKNFSSGMVARIAFAIATVIIPDILIVDEVLAVGDFMFQRKCENRISELIEQHGVTVLIVSHSNGQIARLCNKAIWIEKGHARMLGDANLVTLIYGGLAGRHGTTSSEHRILKAIIRALNCDKNNFKTIHGENAIQVATTISLEGLDSTSSEDIVLLCNTTHANAVIGCALAGRLNAATFVTAPDEIPESTLRILIDRQPKRIYLIDCENISEGAMRSLRELPWHPNLAVVTGEGSDDALSCSIHAFQTIQQNGDAPSEATIVAFDSNKESLEFTPSLYRTGCPAFVTKKNDSEAACEIIDFLKESNISTVYFVGAALDPAFSEVADRHGFTVIPVGTSHETDPCLEIGRFVAKRNPEPLNPRRIYLASQDILQWPELITCGFACAKTNSDFLLISETSLDSICDHMDLIGELCGESRLDPIFIGGSEGLGEAERLIFGTLGQ